MEAPQQQRREALCGQLNAFKTVARPRRLREHVFARIWSMLCKPHRMFVPRHWSPGNSSDQYSNIISPHANVEPPQNRQQAESIASIDQLNIGLGAHEKHVERLVSDLVNIQTLQSIELFSLVPACARSEGQPLSMQVAEKLGVTVSHTLIYSAGSNCPSLNS